MIPCQRSWLLGLLLLLCSAHGVAGSSAEEAYVTADGSMDDYYLENGLDYGEDIGVRQYMDDTQLGEIQEALARARHYMQAYSVDDCSNRHESCAIWALLGECERNPRFMNVTCPPLCQACDSLVVDEQCRRDPNGVDSWYPGDVNKMFEKILVEHNYYDIRVLQRPYYAPGDTKETATYQIGPWIITLEDFLTDEEADHMVALGETEGYAKTSYRTEEQEADEEFMKGLQHTAGVVYCQSENCYYDPVHQAILGRMSNITFLPKENHEFFQMIRYREGQWFKTHNDFAPHHALKPAGVRLTTFLVYHSDVEEGGGTSFDYFNLVVNPKKGRAVIFSCVTNEDPNKRDNLMDHEALKVIKGTKYAFNTHAHQRDYQTPYSRGCGT